MTRGKDEMDGEEGSWRLSKRESLKLTLMQLRCFLGDDAYPVTDAEVDAMPAAALNTLEDEAGERLHGLWAAHHDRQREREHDGLKDGIDNYRKARDKRLARGWAAEDAVGRKMIDRFEGPVRDAIIDFRIRAKTGEATRNAVTVRFLDCLRPDVAAYITVHTALSLCLQAHHRGFGYVLRRDIVRELGTHLEAEYRLGLVAKAETLGDTADLKKITDAEKALEHVTDREKRRLLKQNIRRAKDRITKRHPEGDGAGDRGDWTPPYSQLDKQAAALELLNRLVENSGGAFGHNRAIMESKGHKLRTPGIFFASKKLWEEYQARHGSLEFLSPVERPMVLPPGHWNTARGELGGGYRFDMAGGLKMVKTYDREALRRVDRTLLEPMPILAETLDALQDTPFRINRRVYEVMKEVDDGEAWTRYGLPTCNVPKYSADAPWVWAAWKREGEGKMFAFKNILKAAGDDLTEPMLFFPYAFDFRGRVYAGGGALNPQGTKYARALLEFAEGRRMGDDAEAGKWLMIHGANCYGMDKESIADRVGWTTKHSADIVNVAAAPFDSHNRAWWTGADEPWLFLAFCFEWADFMERGAGHVTHLPIHVDGKCNGVQHMAALMRDGETGKLVGLRGDDESVKPFDLYQAVASMAEARIKRDAARGNASSADAGDKALAKRIMDAIAKNPGGDFQIDRKLVKKAVMAYGYGITAHSMMEDIGDVIFERLRPVDNADEDGDGVLGRQWKILCPQEDATASDDGEDDSGDDDAKEKDYTFGKIKSYLQRVILEAIEAKALAAATVMKVLKGLAGTLTRTPGEGGTGCGPIAWTSPAGFPVYFVEEKRRYKTLRTNLYPDAATRRKDEAERKERKDRNRKGARSVTLRVIDDDGKPRELDAVAMRTGFPPDVIHSLDAAHLMKTVTACRARGIRSFAMIHDSYATHAPNMAAMNEELRRAFVDMYRGLDVNTLAAGIAMETGEASTTGERFEAPTVDLTGTPDIETVQNATYFFA